MLDADAFDAEVSADIALARAFGATGVPFFVFDRKYAVSGAQETALFTEVLDKAWSDAQPLTVVGGARRRRARTTAAQSPAADRQPRSAVTPTGARTTRTPRRYTAWVNGTPTR